MGRPNRLQLLESFSRAAVVATVVLRASRYLPRPMKWGTVFIMALNIRSFPTIWHFRTLWRWIYEMLRHRYARLLGGEDGGLRYLTYKTKQCSFGKSPLEIVQTMRSRAGIGDCDYNLHLSNSSYGKNLDYVRMDAAVACFPGFVSAGGGLALGGTYFHFIKEIPMFAEYEVRLYFGGWESTKWVYLYAQFLTYPKKGKSDSKGLKSASGGSATAKDVAKDLLKGVVQSHPSSSFELDDSGVLVPPVTTTSAGSSGAPSGIVSPTPRLANGGISTPDTSRIFIETAPVPEGATLHATAVSQYCFKHGRITVPPRVGFIVSGFGNTDRWERLKSLRRTKEGRKKFIQLLRGGWKDESEGDFWSFAECEPEGIKRGTLIKGLRDVVEGLEAPQ